MPMFNYIPHFRMVGISQLFLFPAKTGHFVFGIQRAQRLPMGDSSPLEGDGHS